MQLVLVTRHGCHLCEEAEAELRRLKIEFETADVDADADMARLYDFRVPVLLDGGRPVAEGRLDADRLRSMYGAGR